MKQKASKNRTSIAGRIRSTESKPSSKIRVPSRTQHKGIWSRSEGKPSQVGLLRASAIRKQREASKVSRWRRLLW